MSPQLFLILALSISFLAGGIGSHLPTYAAKPSRASDFVIPATPVIPVARAAKSLASNASLPLATDPSATEGSALLAPQDDRAHLVVLENSTWKGEILYTLFDPPVVPSHRKLDVRFEVKVQGPVGRIELVPSIPPASSPLELHDDGESADLLANDSVYSASLDPRPFLEALQADDVNRIFVGFLDVYVGTERVFRGNTSLDIKTPDIPVLPVVPLAADAQGTTHVVNILDPSAAEGLDAQRIVGRFYDLLPDEFDFLNVVSMLSRFENRHHIFIRNAVHGIGLNNFDASNLWGDSAKLLGVNVFPIAKFFDGAEPGYQHELGHQWIQHLGIEPFEQAQPHWPLSNLAGGIMGWSLKNGQGSSFPCLLINEDGSIRLVPRVDPEVFTDLDLYLMGFLPRERVGPIYVFPQQGSPGYREILDACDGSVWPGPLIEVGVDDIIEELGPRVPTSSTSQRKFRIGTVLVSHDRLLDQNTMAFYSYFARRAEAKSVLAGHLGFLKSAVKPFFLSTRGLGELDARVLPGEDPPPPPPPPPPTSPPPPPGPWLSSHDFQGFEVKVEFYAPSGTVLAGKVEPRCIEETLCISGALQGRPEVFLKVIGPRPNGFLWVQISRFTPSRLGLWIRQLTSGDTRYYELDAVGPSEENVSGLQDRTAFEP